MDLRKLFLALNIVWAFSPLFLPRGAHAKDLSDQGGHQGGSGSNTTNTSVPSHTPSLLSLIMANREIYMANLLVILEHEIIINQSVLAEDTFWDNKPENVPVTPQQDQMLLDLSAQRLNSVRVQKSLLEQTLDAAEKARIAPHPLLDNISTREDVEQVILSALGLPPRNDQP